MDNIQDTEDYIRKRAFD